MNTLTNAYLKKISSGTVAALLVFSGILFLVPFAAPVHASNQSPPTLTVTSGSPILGNTGTWVEISVANPATNLYALTGLTITAPSGWDLSSCDWFANQFSSCSVNFPLDTTAQFGSATGVPVAPGNAAEVEVYITAPVPVAPVTYPYTGTFTSTAQDQSNNQFYNGPSFQLEVIDPATSFTFSTNPATPYVAGSAAETVTITQNGGTPQAGLVIDWSLSVVAGYASGSYSLTATSVTAVSGGVATASATFKPSNHAGDETAIVAEVGSSGVMATSSDVTTVPGSPSTVAFQTSFARGTPDSFPATFYISGLDNVTSFGTPTVTPSLGTMAEVPSAAVIGVAVADHFGNPLPFSTATLVVSQISVTALSGGGGFDNGGSALLTTVSCTTVGESCSGVTEGQISKNYFQGYAYATIGVLQATISGTYGASNTPYVVGGASGNIFTSAEAVGITTNAYSSSGNIVAGGSVKVLTNMTGSKQPGVPIVVSLCPGCAGMSTGYGGANSGFGSAGGPQVTGGNTVYSGTTSANSWFAVSYFVDTVAGSIGAWNSTASDPYNGAASNVLTSVESNLITTVAGPASTLTIVFYYKSTLPGPSADPTGPNIVAGLTVYPDGTLADKYGNVVTNPEPYQAQITLSASSGSLSTTTAYIASGGSDTYSDIGAIAYFTPSSAPVGTVLTVTASGNVAGNQVQGAASLTTVSPLPTFSITSPSAQLNNVIYTSNPSTVFHGWANVSTGYDPATTNIVKIGYKVNANSYYATITAANTINFAIATFLTTGLNTIQFNATDSNSPSNTFVSSTYQVLVDNTLPVVKFPKTTTFSYGTSLPVTIFDTEGDLNVSSVSAWFGSHNLNVTAANIVGTNTLGANSTFTLNLNNIGTGTWQLKVQASDYSGNSVVATESVTVTVAFANSVIYVSNSATFTTEGAYSGVLASFTNAWSSAQSLVIFAKYTNSSGSWVYAASLSLNAGQTSQVFVPITVPQIAAGTYTLTLFAVTTGNLPVSSSTTIPGFTVT